MGFYQQILQNHSLTEINETNR